MQMVQQYYNNKCIVVLEYYRSQQTEKDIKIMREWERRWDCTVCIVYCSTFSYYGCLGINSYTITCETNTSCAMIHMHFLIVFTADACVATDYLPTCEWCVTHSEE